MNLQTSLFLRCQCGEPIVLPYQSPLGIAKHPRYLPTAAWPATFACTHCGQSSVYSADMIRLEGIEAPDQNLPPESLWRVEFECGLGSCKKHYAIYTKYRTDALKSTVIDAVRRSNPGPRCDHRTNVPFLEVDIQRFDR